MSPAFRRVSSSPLFSGSLVSVESLTLEGPGGERIEREVVRHPGAVVVVPLASASKVVMVRQYRAAIDQDLLEIPAGKRDVDGEDPAKTAERELAEEVGRRAGRLDLLARFYNSPGFCDEFTWLYLAQDLSDVPDDRQGLEEQHMAIEEIDLASVPGLIREGTIVDAKSIIGLSLTREYLRPA